LPDKGETLDVLGAVQGTAEDKVMGVGRGTRPSPRRQKLGYVRSWKKSLRLWHTKRRRSYLHYAREDWAVPWHQIW
jgi:hypothetical protein